MRELLAKDTIALTVVHMYKKNGYIFTKSEAAFPDGTAPIRSLVFAKNPQPECVSVPVFQKADQHKLYFGDIYNVTGYEFLHAYAFTTYCACEGTCCGQVQLTERKVKITGSVYGFDYVISDANQTLYIANFLTKDNSSWAKPNSTICIGYS
ncbi:unnamed protein product [Cylicocyclus nassatus]|uniref:Uncharacterized protein n=1 Tax=Cylicocyclus nassatus TaxID=53992 RepID=A0AA36GP43_CYLNA|nr:unnamed protein product [Cylicocyclus nassatus]